MGENPGGRHGAGEYNAQLDRIQRVNRITELKLQEKDLTDDQNLFRNQYGLLECKLCCTHHRTEASYIAHTYGKQHQRNLERRRVVLARKEAMNGGCRIGPQPQPAPMVHKQPKIGDPAFNIFKNKNPTGSLTILFELTYDQIRKNTSPRYRIMSAFEQRVDSPDPNYQYVVFAAQPYNTVAFKIPNLPILEDQIIHDWKPSEHIYTFQVTVSPPPTQN
ncbi:putative splicing factor 3A subunit 2 [Histomonas meleagridis]|uniref:putative splicing factor 3A subunit 2 n=1 Tax=Histomonas meleagridis TaxID=135588 RepID=UPI003559D40B|nr:putative splicing factor 3A subunit 2 [Histomonas meleagridis]KAH0801711.1 putative splicing factor 3A subunit 2 [Histomonas meleagridis]